MPVAEILTKNKMENIEQNAITSFRAGLNCAQAVVTAFAEKVGYDREMAAELSAGFGGGMGRLQQTCGVVTGAYMVIGMHQSRLYADNVTRKEKSYEMIREFHSRFMEMHGTDQCSGLISCDLSTPEGREQANGDQNYLVSFELHSVLLICFVDLL